MHTDMPYTKERKLFGHAIAFDPLTLASVHADIISEDMPRIATDYIVESAARNGIVNKREIIHRDLLRAGIQDTQTFYDCIRAQVPLMDERLAIASHWKSRRALAELALESSSNIGLRLGDYGRSGNNFRLSDDGTYITPITDIIPPLTTGCPFAGHNEKRTIDPLFPRFNDWTMRLIFSHDDLTKKTP